MDMLKAYWYHIVGRRLRLIRSHIKLWHYEITLGEHITDNYHAMDLADEISWAETRKWNNRVWKHKLERPPNRDDEHTYYTIGFQDSEEKYITSEGIRFIREQYRAEQSYIRDNVIKWATLIFAAIGALVALYKL